MKRYEPNYDPYQHYIMDEEPDGEYVKYTEAKAIIDTKNGIIDNLIRERRQALATEENNHNG